MSAIYKIRVFWAVCNVSSQFVYFFKTPLTLTQLQLQPSSTPPAFVRSSLPRAPTSRQTQLAKRGPAWLGPRPPQRTCRALLNLPLSHARVNDAMLLLASGSLVTRDAVHLRGASIARGTFLRARCAADPARTEGTQDRKDVPMHS